MIRDMAGCSLEEFSIARFDSGDDRLRRLLLRKDQDQYRFAYVLTGVVASKEERGESKEGLITAQNDPGKFQRVLLESFSALAKV